jgi:uncharacterized protein YutE (UPF0331/DUF86 family)
MVTAMQYDEERLGSILSDIHRYIKDFEDLNIIELQQLQDKRNFYAVSMIFFSLLNRVFDLGSEMVMAHNLGIPKNYRDIFVMLRDNGLISPDLQKTLSELVTTRNLLAHEYHGITPGDLFKATKNLDDINDFVQLMQKRILQD